MKKVIVFEHISLDGVIQAPGRTDEDSSDGFMHGGWASPYSDPAVGTAITRWMNKPLDLLLGRKTFEIWEQYWPHHADIWPSVNTVTKYVASNTRTSSEWQPSVFLSGDVAEKVAQIKQQPGPDLNVWGSGNFLQTLIKHDLVDTFWLMIFPVTLGSGKRLFAHGTMPMAFKVTESIVASNGVIAVNCERAGAITMGGESTL
jgi:dihydrofolate reductase